MSKASQQTRGPQPRAYPKSIFQPAPPPPEIVANALPVQQGFQDAEQQVGKLLDEVQQLRDRLLVVLAPVDGNDQAGHNVDVSGVTAESRICNRLSALTGCIAQCRALVSDLMHRLEF